MEDLSKILPFYLPYGLSVKCIKSFENMITGYEIVEWQGPHLLSVEMLYALRNNKLEKYIRPILYPLEYLTKEIEHNGNKFIPVKKLFATWSEDKKLKYSPDYRGYLVIWLEDKNGKLLTDELTVFGDYLSLIEWHFNIFNLPQDQFINKTIPPG